MLAYRAKETFQGAEEKMNTKGRKQTLVIALAMMAALTIGSSMAWYVRYML
jgi:hypothetical protein